MAITILCFYFLAPGSREYLVFAPYKNMSVRLLSAFPAIIIWSTAEIRA